MNSSSNSSNSRYEEETPQKQESCCGQNANKDSPDYVNHPPHYTATAMECIDAIEGLNLGYHAGNVLKYLVRYKLKQGVLDLKKAQWYLDRLIMLESK